MSTISKANDIQFGGDHYKGQKVEHWDYAHELPYLEGTATKYIARHAKKNKLQDLLKAGHYLRKIIELRSSKLHTFGGGDYDIATFEEFSKGLPREEREALEAINSFVDSGGVDNSNITKALEWLRSIAYRDYDLEYTMLDPKLKVLDA